MWVKELIISALEFLKSPRLCIPVLLASVVVWLLPDEFLKAHGLEQVARYRGWAIMAAIASGAILTSEAGIWLWGRVVRWWGVFRFKRRVARDIPYMTERERAIFAYLLAHNEKGFMYTPDGGYATGLIGKGYIVLAARPGQMLLNGHQTPFSVPEPVWQVLMKHRADFPYTPPKPGETVPNPWAVHYMER